MKSVPDTGELAGLMPANKGPEVGVEEEQAPNADVLAQKSADPNAPIPASLLKELGTQNPPEPSANPTSVVNDTVNAVGEMQLNESLPTTDLAIAKIAAQTSERVSFVDKMFAKFGSIWEALKDKVGGIFSRSNV